MPIIKKSQLADSAGGQLVRPAGAAGVLAEDNVRVDGRTMPIAVPGGSRGAGQFSPNGSDGTLRLIKEGQIVTAIQFTCKCGEQVTIHCDYAV